MKDKIRNYYYDHVWDLGMKDFDELTEDELSAVREEMEKVEDLVTDKQIDLAWGNANFGVTHSKREVIANTLLKCASGYHTGHTAKCIVEELGLVTQKWQLRQRGKRYLFAAYSGGLSL